MEISRSAPILKKFVNLTEWMQARIQAVRSATTWPTPLQVGLWTVVLLSLAVISIDQYPAHQVGTTQDDAQYVILARSLVQSKVYGMINKPGEPGLGKFPFGYPLFLAPGVLLFPNNLNVLRASSLVLTILNMALLFWGWQWIYPRKSYWWGLAISGLYALAPMTVDQTRMIMAEPLFMFFCLTSILLGRLYVQGFRPAWWSTAISFTLIFSAVTRTIGFILVAVVLTYLLVATGWQFWKKIVLIGLQMAALVGLVLAVTPVQVRDLIPTEYLRDENARFVLALFNRTPLQPALSSAPSANAAANPAVAAPVKTKATSLEVLFFFNLKQHFGKDLRWVALPVGGGAGEDAVASRLGIPWAPWVIGYGISCLVILGFVRILWHDRLSLFTWFGFIYFGVMMLWVWDTIRLLYPVQPLILFSFIAGVEAFLVVLLKPFRKRIPQIGRYGLAVVATCLIVISGLKSATLDDTRQHNGDLASRSTWLTAHTAPAAIVMTELPETDYLYSARKTVGYPDLSTAEQLRSDLLSSHVQYVLVAPENVWQEQYTMMYSHAVKTMLPLLAELSAQHFVRPVYDSKADGIQIFQVQY